MRDPSLSEKASQVLRDLELQSLRSRFGLARPRTKSSNGRYSFYFDPIGFASTKAEREALLAEAQWLNRFRKIVLRRVELAIDGIWPSVVAYSEPGHEELAVFVEFTERGRRVLVETGPALSSALAFVRRVLSLGIVAVALVAVPLYLGERVLRQGWQQTLISISVLVAFVVLTRRPWREGE